MVGPAPVFKLERSSDILIVSPLGHSLQFASGEVERQANQILQAQDEQPAAHLLIDFGKVSMVDSIVVGALFSLVTRFHKSGGQVRMCNVSSRMREMLNVVNFHRLVDESATREEALAAMES